MKLGKTITLIIAISTLCWAGCGQNAEEQVKQNQKLDEITKSAQKSAEEASKAAQEADKAKAEATAAKDEAAKAKAQAANAVADAEKARVEASAEAAKAQVKVDEATATAEAASAELDKVKAEGTIRLAIDMGCALKLEQDPAKSAAYDRNLLTAAGSSQRAHMAALQKIKQADPSVQARIDAAVQECPSPEETEFSKVVGITVRNKCLREAKLAPEQLRALQVEIMEDFQLTGKEFADMRAKHKQSPEFAAAVAEGFKNCPPIDPPPAPAAGKKAKAPAPTPQAGPTMGYAGKIFGSANGSLVVKVNKGKVGGTVQINKISIPLKGHMLANGNVSIFGKSGAHTFRGSAKASKNRSRLTGNWKARINDKKRSGSFVVRRK